MFPKVDLENKFEKTLREIGNLVDFGQTQNNKNTFYDKDF